MGSSQQETGYRALLSLTMLLLLRISMLSAIWRSQIMTHQIVEIVMKTIIFLFLPGFYLLPCSLPLTRRCSLLPCTTFRHVYFTELEAASRQDFSCEHRVRVRVIPSLKIKRFNSSSPSLRICVELRLGLTLTKWDLCCLLGLGLGGCIWIHFSFSFHPSVLTISILRTLSVCLLLSTGVN